MPHQLRFARTRVTVSCTECASPIPVNGIVSQVLCGACQAVVTLEGVLGWDLMMYYQRGEHCSEHNIIGGNVRALDYFLTLGSTKRQLTRHFKGIIVEIDDSPPVCNHCRAPIDPDQLFQAARAGASGTPCPACGQHLPLRPAAQIDQYFHPSIVAVAGETAPTGDLHEPEKVDPVLFSCLGCGAALKIDGTSQRMVLCEFCDATSYLPDALWLRLHPAQRKQPFWFVLWIDDAVIEQTVRDLFH